MYKLTDLPGVGKETEKDLLLLGYTSIESLKDADPEKLYKAECDMKGTLIDRCQLYVYRCAVYCAKNGIDKASGVNWWNFKDK